MLSSARGPSLGLFAVRFHAVVVVSFFPPVAGTRANGGNSLRVILALFLLLLS